MDVKLPLNHSCCSPPDTVRSGAATERRALSPLSATSAEHSIAQVHVPGQTFRMGDAHGDGRRPDGKAPCMR